MFHKLMKGRIWPVPYLRYPAMLDRIKMYVICMASKVGFVTDGVFPITRLPQFIFSPRILQELHTLLYECAGEMALDTAPASRIVIITVR